MPVERYRDALDKGRIRFADLQSVLREDLAERATESIANLCTVLRLRLAMLQYPLRTGRTHELLWFVEETDALRRVRPEVSAGKCRKLIAETRRWVMRDLRGAPTDFSPPWFGELLSRFREGGIETWTEERWEAFAARIALAGLPGGRS